MSRPRAKSLGELLKRKSADYRHLATDALLPITASKSTHKFLVERVNEKGSEARILCVTEQGLHLLDPTTENELEFYPIEKIKQWYIDRLEIVFVHKYESVEEIELRVSTRQTKEIHEAMNKSIKSKLKSEKKGSGSFLHI